MACRVTGCSYSRGSSLYLWSCSLSRTGRFLRWCVVVRRSWLITREPAAPRPPPMNPLLEPAELSSNWLLQRLRSSFSLNFSLEENVHFVGKFFFKKILHLALKINFNEIFIWIFLFFSCRKIATFFVLIPRHRCLRCQICSVFTLYGC